jgi:drug/metabolite transporter (DMT)-like permease
MVASATAAVFFSETVLSLYPILIKKVQTNLDTQILSRFLIYPIAALIVGGLKPLSNAYSHGIAKNLGLGAINVGHIATSYLAFQQLPAGIAMSLFYTYPLWNLIGASLVFGEPFPWHLFPVLLIALGAAAVIAFSRTEDRLPEGAALRSASGGHEDQKHEGNEVNWLGVGAALAAAITETLIFLAVKSEPKETPFFSVHQIYLGGLPILIGYLLWKNWKNEEKGQQQPTIDWSFKTWLPLLLFNGLLGFTGYCLRFWSIPRLSTLLYSILSMFGVLAAFTWGHFLADEPVQGQGLIGAIVLTACIGILRYFS